LGGSVVLPIAAAIFGAICHSISKSSDENSQPPF
jgi:hypothetical protein